MYGDWGCHCADKEMNEVFPMDRWKSWVRPWISDFSIIYISIWYIDIDQAILKDGYSPYFPMRCPVEDYILHLRKNQMLDGVWAGAKWS